MTDRRGLRFYMCVFAAYLCSLGMEFWFLDLFRLLTVSIAVRTALVLILYFAVFVAMRYRLFLYGLTGSLSVAALIAFLLFRSRINDFSPHLQDFMDWVLRLPSGEAENNPLYAWIFSLIFVMAISLFIWLFIFSFRKTMPVLLGMFASCFGVCLAYRHTELHFVVLIPACIGLVILLSLTSKGESESAHQGKKINPRLYFAALGALLAAASAVLLFAVVFERRHPAEQMYSKTFKAGVNSLVLDLIKRFEKPESVPEEMRLFDAGIVGLNSRNGTLGGPVEMTDEIYLEVTSNRDVLLKSRTCNHYGVTYWDNDRAPLEMFFEVPDDAPFSFGSRPVSAIEPASLPDDMSPEAIQIDFFDAFRPDARTIDHKYLRPVLTETDVTIRNASEYCGATIFYPDHLRDVAYSGSLFFDESASLYAKNNIPIGDSYTVRSNVFRTEQSVFENELLNLEKFIRSDYSRQDPSSHIDSIRADYLETNVPSSVVRYALQISSGAETPLEKAFAIKKHLSENFTYSLDVPEVPPGRDFVEYFLETREGYCVYFASAMCMMARAVNVPARFAEGFIADISEKPSGAPSTVIVTGQYAHAWCEIYIDGIGWIPFDATPGGVGIDYDPGNTEATPTPTPTEKPEPTEGPTPGAETTIAETTPGTTKTPTPTKATTPSNTTVPGGEPMNGSRNAQKILSTLLKIFVILIGLAAVVALIVLPYVFIDRRYYRIPPAEKIAEDLSPEARLTFLYRRCLNHLGLLGFRIIAPESPSDFAERARSVRATTPGCTHDLHSFDIQAVALTYERLVYGLIPPSEEDIAIAYDTCRAVSKEVYRLYYSRLHYYASVVFGRKGTPHDIK